MLRPPREPCYIARTLRYLKATVICGFLAALFAVGLFELGAFRGMDAALAKSLALPSPPAASRALQYALVLALSFGVAWTTIDVSRSLLKMSIAIVLLIEVVAAAWVLHLFGIFFSPYASIAATLNALAFGLLYAQSPAGQRKGTLYELLGDRVSARTFDTLLNSDVPLKFDGAMNVGTVLVCEIFNHDELVAALRLPDYVAMTNAFLRNAADFLVERGAYLDACDSERVRAIFGAPLPEPNHAALACEAALELVDRLDGVNEECLSLWSQRFDYRVSINTGEMLMAASGAHRLGTFSVSGEVVDFTSRMCAANTIYGTRTLISSHTFMLAESAVEVRPLELIQRHRDKPDREEVYELLARTDTLSTPERERRDDFWKAVILFREKRWDEALVLFRKTALACGKDEPSEFYITRIEQMKADLPVIHLTATQP